MEVYLVVFWVKKDCWVKEELEGCWVKEDRWVLQSPTSRHSTWPGKSEQKHGGDAHCRSMALPPDSLTW